MKYFTGDEHEDSAMMLSILSNIEIKSGTNRKKMCSQGGSALFGNSWRGFLKYDKDGVKILRPKDPNKKGRFLTKLKVEEPELQIVFEEYRNRWFPSFEFNSVMINHNFPIGKHKDNANVGLSVLVTFGDFTGGMTRVWDDDETFEDLNSLATPVCFDGSKYFHECLPFEGNRYALVFFNN